MERSRRREIQDRFDFKGIETTALFRDDKPKESVGFDVEDTLMRIETNMVMSTMKKNLIEVVWMVREFS